MAKERAFTDNMVEWICVVLIIGLMAHCQYRGVEAEAEADAKVKIEELRIKHEVQRKKSEQSISVETPVLPSEKN